MCSVIILFQLKQATQGRSIKSKGGFRTLGIEFCQGHVQNFVDHTLGMLLNDLFQLLASVHQLPGGERGEGLDEGED